MNTQPNIKLLERQIASLVKANHTLTGILSHERKTIESQRQTIAEHNNIFRSIATLCRKQAD